VIFFAAVLAAPPAEARWAGRLDVRATAFDGGEVRYDGTYYDFRAANGIQMIKMWVPPDAEPLRGVLFHGNPGGYGDTRDIPRDERLQEFAARHDFAIMGVTSFPGRRIYPELAEVIVRAMDDWAKLGHHPEIANLPMIARGSSNAGVTAYSLACYVPERMICFTPNVGPAYNPPVPPEKALQVPALLHVGPEDPFFPDGVANTRELFANARPRGARWAWTAEKGKGHAIGHIDDVDMKFYETCIELRLPPDADPREGPVELRDLPEQEGWLVDMSSWDSGLTRIAPYGDCEGERESAGWVPTRDIAFLYRSVATYDNPLSVSVRDLGPVDNPQAEGVMLRSVGGNVVEPGRRVALECDPDGFPGWTRIEFYDGAEKLGEAHRGEEPAIEFVVQPEPTVYALTVLAYGEDGTLRTAAPTHFLVRDPEVRAALAAQRSAHRKLLPRPPRPPYGSSATGSAAESASAADATDQVLLAYGLSAEQEKQFAADGRMSPFWAGFNGSHDHVVLNVTDHLAERGEAWESAEAEGDAEVAVRAARSRAGLYLLFEVADDEWAAPVELLDSLDFHLARQSSKEIWEADPAEAFVKRESWALVLSGNQHQVNLGTNDRPPTKVFRNYPDPWDVARAEDDFAAARERYGIVLDLETTGPHTKAVEWFIPWEYVGHGGPMGEPPTGRRLGLSLGYNDHDPTRHPANEFDRLRWNHGLDPWWQAADDGPNPSPWGDLEMGPMLAD
jgi:hypothetical protein